MRNGRLGSPLTLDEFEVLPGIGLSVEVLKGAGLLAVVITNQPDVARGLLAPDELKRMNERLRYLVPVDAIYICPHDDKDGCLCRKPKPGLLLRASQELNIRLRASYLVGDSWKDIAAGRSAGCKTFLVKTADSDSGDIGADCVVAHLEEAAELIARGTRGSHDK